MVRSPSGRSISGSERRWLKVFGTLDEFQARLFAADKALDLGVGRHESRRGIDGTLADDDYQSSRGVERRRKAGESGGRSGEASGWRKKKGRRSRSGCTGSVGEDPGGNNSRGSDESVAVDEQIDTNHGGGVDSFRAPGHMGDGSALPER